MLGSVADVLDRANEALVRLRLGRRQPLVDPQEIEAYIAALPDDPLAEPTAADVETFEPHPSPEEDGRATGRDADGGAELWEATSPWAAGGSSANARWVATRMPPRRPRRAGATRAAGVAGADGGASSVPPALILLHGWLAAWWHFPVYSAWGRRVARAGIETWLPRLPHHMERTAPGKVSGEACLSSDLIGTVAALRQAVAEARALAAWLRRHGRPRVGIWGMSLGGWIAGLVASTDPTFDAAVLWAPVASPERTLWDGSFARDIREALERSGVSRADAWLDFKPLSLIQRRPRVAAEDILLVGARYDRIVEPGTLEELAQAWGVGIWWTPHGHISLMGSPGALRATSDFLRARLSSSTG